MPPLKPYSGPARKLVLGIDVGTTYSGVSYAILDPGEIPKIQGVTRFPGQENAAGDCKIPSIMYYRPDGTVHSVGAEAALPGIDLEVEDDDLRLVQWQVFKLHLRPEHLESNELRRRDLPPIPAGKTVLDVFSDFLSYLFACTRRYICETHASGERLWNSVKDQIEFVLSHPNGWEGLQQSKMRQAAITAGLVPDSSDGRARVHFVTEGEASLHFCVQSGLTSDSIETGQSVMIVDAGGGTVDISSYAFTATDPVSVEEVASAECIVQGSTRVNMRAQQHLEELLKDSAYGNIEDIKTMMDYFDKSTKPIFKDANESSYIKFGTMRCNDAKVRIQRGRLTLTGAEMESFFKLSLDGIIHAVQRQRQAASQPVSTVFLVGGFAASPWLYTSLQKALGELGLTLCRPDTHTNKAVSEGAVHFFLERFVSSRVIKTTYGTQISTDFNPTNPEHNARRQAKIFRPSGRIMLQHAFAALLTKGTSVRESVEIKKSFCKESREPDKLSRMSAEILCYKGNLANPRWVDVEPELYVPLCTVYADTSKVTKTPRIGNNGRWYLQDFDVVLLCGSTELQAQISWVENGKEMRGPATIVYDDDLEEPLAG